MVLFLFRNRGRLKVKIEGQKEKNLVSTDNPGKSFFRSANLVCCPINHSSP